MSEPAITLYSFPLSGHAHRVTLLLSLLGRRIAASMSICAAASTSSSRSWR